MDAVIQVENTPNAVATLSSHDVVFLQLTRPFVLTTWVTAPYSHANMGSRDTNAPNKVRTAFPSGVLV